MIVYRYRRKIIAFFFIINLFLIHSIGCNDNNKILEEKTPGEDDKDIELVKQITELQFSFDNFKNLMLTNDNKRELEYFKGKNVVFKTHIFQATPNHNYRLFQVRPVGIKNDSLMWITTGITPQNFWWKNYFIVLNKSGKIYLLGGFYRNDFDSLINSEYQIITEMNIKDIIDLYLISNSEIQAYTEIITSKNIDSIKKIFSNADTLKIIKTVNGIKAVIYTSYINDALNLRELIKSSDIQFVGKIGNGFALSEHKTQKKEYHYLRKYIFCFNKSKKAEISFQVFKKELK